LGTTQHFINKTQRYFFIPTILHCQIVYLFLHYTPNVHYFTFKPNLAASVPVFGTGCSLLNFARLEISPRYITRVELVHLIGNTPHRVPVAAHACVLVQYVAVVDIVASVHVSGEGEVHRLRGGGRPPGTSVASIYEMVAAII
jgi:hypothetical protein